MTLVSDIISRAYRASNLIPLGVSPTSDQITEALNQFVPLLLSTVGNEAGDDLIDLNVGGDFDQSELLTDWVPDNTQLLINGTAAQTLKLDPYPKDGQRVAVIDVANNLATYPVTLDGNGRNIEAAATLVLNTNGLTRQWMYRADLGNWLRIASVATTDAVPFPVEFDPYFELMLALRLNPQYGQSLTQEQVKMLARSRSQLNARYNQNPKEVGSDIDWRSIPSQQRYWGATSDFSDFDTGRVRKWM